MALNHFLFLLMQPFQNYDFSLFKPANSLTTKHGYKMYQAQQHINICSIITIYTTLCSEVDLLFNFGGILELAQAK